MDTRSPPAATVSTLPTEILEALERRIADGKIEFPSMPDVASQVVSATFDEDCDLSRIERIVQRDPHLTAQLLKMVNSALYAPATPVTALKQALAIVGMTRVRDIALLVSCESRVFQIEGFELELAQLLEHAKTTAVYAREVARAAGGVDLDESFCAGLLHDVGRAILIQTIVDLRVIVGVKLRRKIELEPRAVLDAARARHEVVGAGLLASWELPDRLVQAVRGHHDPASAEEDCRPLATTLRVADDLAHAFVDEGTVTAAAEIGLDDGRVTALAERRVEIEGIVREL